MRFYENEMRADEGLGEVYSILTLPPSKNPTYHFSGITVLRGLDLGALF